MVEYSKECPVGAFNHFLHSRHMQDFAEYIMRNPPEKASDWGFMDIEVVPTDRLCSLKLDRTRAIFVQGDTVYFCHSFACEFNVAENVDTIGAFLDIEGRIDFHGKTYDFSLNGIHYYEQNVLSETYTQNYIPKYPGVRANQLLIPDLSGMTLEQCDRRLDKEATWFLKKYYPASLKSITPVPIRKIVENYLHLTVFSDKKLTDSLQVLGEVIFSDKQMTVIDESTGEEETLVFPRGSILIDSKLFWERGLGSFNFTIAHELYHWLRHRAHIAFMQFVDIPDDYAHWKSIMEGQASGFAACVLMPTHAIRKFYSSAIGNQTDDESYEIAAAQCARFFYVSKGSVKNRLNDLRIHEKQYPPPVCRRIDLPELFELYATDDLFHEIMENRSYLYIDHYVVKNDPLYVEQIYELETLGNVDEDDASYTLTSYALEHLEECTLLFRQFSKRLVSDKFDTVLHKAGSYSLTMDYNIRMQLTNEGKRIEEVSDQLTETEIKRIQKKRHQTERLRAGYQAKFESFWDRVEKWPTLSQFILPIIMKKNEQLMTLDILDDDDDAIQEAQKLKKKKASKVGVKKADAGYKTRYFWHEDFPTGKRWRVLETEVFQARTLVTYKKFEQIRSNSWKKPDINMVIAICAGYHFTIQQVEEALKYAGYILIFNRTHLVYRFLFTFCRDQFHDTDTFNTLLIYLNEKPVGSTNYEKTADKKKNETADTSVENDTEQ